MTSKRHKIGRPPAPLSTPTTNPSNVIALRDGPARGHPHPVNRKGDTPDLKRYRTPEDDWNLRRRWDERRYRLHAAALTRHLALLPTELRQSEEDIYDDLLDAAPTELKEQGAAAVQKWAINKSHEQMAAVILAVGGTQQEAAMHAGVGVATIARMLRQPEFVEAVNGQRRRLLSRVQGGVLAELERRVFGGDVLFMDTRDVLAILDKTADLGGAEVVARRERAPAAVHNGGNVTIHAQLAAIAAAPAQRLVGPGSGPPGNGHNPAGHDDRLIEGTVAPAEDADIPVFGLDSDTVATPLPPIAGALPRS